MIQVCVDGRTISCLTALEEGKGDRQTSSGVWDELKHLLSSRWCSGSRALPADTSRVFDVPRASTGLSDIMCYFDQTRWTCGYWRWGHFRQQCPKEYRMGETCGLKLVYETKPENDVCKLCHDIEKKQRRYDKMYRDVERWQREGGKPATIERTTADMKDILAHIYRMTSDHDYKLQSLGQV